MDRLGEFVLRERLGEGGFATVWRADQPALGRDAVVKVLHARGEADKFLAEVKLAARLDHPYAAHVYAFGAEPDGRLWIAMERVRGTALDELLLAAGPMPLERVVPLVDRLCEVVQTAHEQGIVHRDIKPANVMVLARAGRLLPKLLDLGVAAPLGEAGGARAGTPRYMAPEVWAESARVDGRADVYALGVLTFECLTGRPPFDGSSWYAVAKAHAKKPVPPLGPGFPPALDAVLARAMAKKPEDRYPTAGELGAALRSASGIIETRAPLPQLPAALRDAWMAGAPQPLAEAVAVLDAAGNAHQAAAAARALVSQTVRWLALCALAAASRAGRPAPDRCRELRRRPFTDEEWLALAREQTAPQRERPEAFPLPELARELAAPPDLDVHAPTEEELRGALAARLPALAAWMEGLDWLLAYPLARATGGGAGSVTERWSGIRRAPRARLVTSGPLPAGEAVLVDAEGSPVCLLGPLVQIGAPAPGAAEEVFLLEGPGRHGARLVALPGGFERQDEAPWDFLRARLARTGDDGRRAAAEEQAPWPGLAAFTVDDAARYVGREREAQAFVNRLRVATWLAVVGPSGAGKSSFVQAGVLPVLPEGWRATVFRPGPDPEAALARALAQSADVLVVDQLEELFTLCHDRDAQARFAAALLGGARVVVTLRDDFLMRAQALPALGERLAQGLVLLGTPAEDDLRRILVEPARRAGYDFDDPALPAEMARALADHPGALALLSFTAARLWERRDRHFKRLLRSVHDQTGGVGGALAAHAEETLASLRPDEQRLVREAFRRLVTPDGTRAVMTRADLDHVLGPDGRRVIEALVTARLLVIGEAEHGQERVEVAHEALLDAWPRLVAWRREDATGARLRAQLGSAARQWEERGRARGLLWRDDALADLTRLRRGGEPLTPAEEAFASASLAEAARGRRRRGYVLGAAFAALVAGLLVLLQMNRRTEEQRRQSQGRLAELHEEQGRVSLQGGRPDHALLYLAEAERLGRRLPSTRYLVASAERARSAQIASLAGHTAAIWSAAYSPDGARVVTASDDKTARIWSAADGRQLAVLPHEGAVWRATFSPDGTLVATAAYDGAARLWRVASDGSGTLLRTFRHQDRVYTAAFSPDGARLVTTSRDKNVVVWDVATGAELARHADHAAGVRSAAWRPDGKELATVSDDGSLFIYGEDGQVRLHFDVHARMTLWSVVWSDDGARLATASNDRTAAVWDARDGKELGRLSHGAQVYSAVFQPTQPGEPAGTRVLTASQDGSAGLWTVGADGVALEGSLAHPGIVYAARFSPDGRTIVTAGADGSARIFTGAGLPVARLPGHQDEVRGVAFDPSGARVATVARDGTASLWHTEPPAQLHDLSVLGHRPWTARWSPDGKTVATAGSGDRSVRLWDTERGVEIGRIPREKNPHNLAYAPDGAWLAIDAEDRIDVVDLPQGKRRVELVGQTNQITWLEVAPDGARLASADGDGVRIWDLATGRATISLAPPETQCATFSPDGKLVAVCGADGKIRLHDAAGAVTATLDAGPDALLALAFDRAGRRLLAGGAGKTVRILGLDGSLLAVLLGHTSLVQAVAFAGHGDLAATGGYDGTVRIWDTATGKLLDTFEQHGGRVSSVQWSRNDLWLLSSSYDGSTKIWDMSLDDKNSSDLSHMVACRVPYRLVKGQPVAISLDTKDCPDSMGVSVLKLPY